MITWAMIWGITKDLDIPPFWIMAAILADIAIAGFIF